MSSPSSPTFANWPEGIPTCADLAGEALFARLAARAAATPDACAFPAGGMSYGELLDACQMLAGYMQQRLGVRSGASVLLSLDDCPQRAVAVFAIDRCAARAVPLEPLEPLDSLDSLDPAARVPTTAARAAIVAPASLPELAPLLDDGTLYGCIVCGNAPARPGLHDFAGALSAGIAPLPLIHPLDTWSTKHELA
ncbi:hypothetical protein LMG31506_05232 [Cupriavidus yeoncheonensis]|uniref:AMP-dependent synthetase/ligase domain-containing protein n=1 Tax=Cupriavidus yeoncheonensis TaxID=1462994 RepID=A0A916N6W5_9BURK|nr:AMP-binding protein [Cupriavidus yeoncheonensis]CAG2154902.1 hypothetical protein LMG31506_05232 [Cupriavidus yeoncheonensis]